MNEGKGVQSGLKLLPAYTLLLSLNVFENWYPLPPFSDAFMTEDRQFELLHGTAQCYLTDSFRLPSYLWVSSGNLTVFMLISYRQKSTIDSGQYSILENILIAISPSSVSL